MERIFRYFQSTPIRNLVYAGAFFLILLLVLGFFVWSLFFHIGIIRSLRIAEEEVLPVSTFHFSETAVLDKLGIVLPLAPSRSPSLEPSSSTTPPTASSTSVAASPIPLSEISLRLLNGTTIKGLVKVWQTKFETIGFARIQGGNADRKDYEGVLIRAHPRAEHAVPFLVAEFTKRGVATSSIVSGAPSEGQADDIVITLGK